MQERITLEDYQPRPELVVPAHPVQRARYPVIDAHNHLPIDHAGRVEGVEVEALLRDMDAVNVRTIVNLGDGMRSHLKRSLEALDLAHPGRFASFCTVDWAGVGEEGWERRAVAHLREDVALGARGLKVFKSLGLRVRDVAGRLVMPDDPRLADLWEAAGELKVPVLIHTADPVAFFRPLDRYNERWEELHRHPDWHFHGPEFPPFEALIESLYRTVEAHPRTTFIAAHVGCYAENLGFVSQMLDRYANLYTDISARLAELGRAPYSARAWLCRYADRILFGLDERPDAAHYRVWFRALETADEYIDYVPDGAQPGQGRWRIYGLHLPGEVLRKVYFENTARLLRLGD